MSSYYLDTEREKRSLCATIRARDFLFCEICGTLLSLGSHKYAECSSCGFTRDIKDIAGKETSYTITAEDIRRDLGIEPFVELDGDTAEVEVKRPLVSLECPACHHHEVEYYTKQLRSADEGQTVFYECPKCGYSFRENS